MAKIITNFDDLQDFANGVTGRADHHAPQFKWLIPMLIGLILQYKDKGTPIVAHTYEGKTTNVVWAYLNEQRYAFCYDTKTHDKIHVRVKTQQGPSIRSFSVETSREEVISFFEGLKRSRVKAA